MGSLTQYIINFRNQQLDEIEIKITDYKFYDLTGDNPITTIELEGVAPAFELETFNIAENKFNPILGQRATIRFKSTNQINFSTFSSGEDYRFFVRATRNAGANFIFSGWKIMDDNQQAYLPAGQSVTLYATDNLGKLKEVELSDFDGARPTGKHKLIKIIAWCLKKTNGDFLSYTDRIKVASNLFEANNHSNVNNCPLNQTYVDVLTFEKSIGELEDCHTVLTKILFSLGARGCFYENDFYILRIDEYKNSSFVLHTYDTGGTYISRTNPFTLDKTIDTDIKFVNAETIQRIQRPYKSATCEIDHKFPEEIPANVNFTHGDVDDDVLPLKTFEIDNWTLLRGFGSHSTTPNVEARIWRRYDSLDRESERYAVLTPQASSGGELNYIKSEAIPICIKDKFTFSFDYSADSDNAIDGTASISIAAVALHGDDGSFWILGDGLSTTQESEWKLSDANHDVNADYYKWFFSATSGSEDYRDWKSYEIDAPPAPVTGSIYIHFFAANQLGSGIDDFAIRYNNVKFDYKPLLGGSYKTTTGERYKMSTLSRYTKQFDEKYFLFDAPCKLYRGAMFYEDSGTYYQTANWIDFAMQLYAIPDLLNFAYPFLHWQCNAAWNQARLETWILPSSLHGLDTANGHAGLIHKYSVGSSLSPINRMNFIALSMKQNWHDCTWSATFAEINDSDSVRQGGNSSGENFEFKYLE